MYSKDNMQEDNPFSRDGGSIPPPDAPQPFARETQKSGRDGWRGALSTILILIAAPLIALALTAYVFQSYEVDGPSMETTLHNKDRLIVLKVPRTWAQITGNDYIPNRGDVIIFVERNVQQSIGGAYEKQLVKRVIGLPGDRVVVKDGAITIYNDEFPSGFSPDQNSEWAEAIKTTTGDIDIVVDPGHVFVCGDNRNNSLDSRIFGPVPAEDIVGKLILRIFPVDQITAF